MRQTVLRELQLDRRRHRAAGQTRHLVGGVPFEDTRGLRIVQYENDPGYYLLYLDASGEEVTDTWHQSLADALHQATFEFEVAPEDWTIVG